MHRINDIKNLLSQGWTYQMIGDSFGISRQRVHQLLRKNSLVKNIDKKKERIEQTINNYSERLKGAEKLLRMVEVQREISIYATISEHSKQLKIDLIDFCKKQNIPDEKIEEIIDAGKATIYKIYRYGIAGKPCKSERTEILERDNYQCRKCNSTGKLHIHHIGDPRSKNKENLLTLCPSCHRKEDTRIRNEKITISN